MTWVPIDACTLPTAGQPLRALEFDEVLADAQLVDSCATRVVLRLPADRLEQVQDLAARESACCTFFGFTVTPGPEGVELVVEVPPERAPLLAALLQRSTLT